MIIDWDVVEVIAMTRLGYRVDEVRDMYFGEFWDKFEVYKMLFNRERQGLYQMGQEEFDSLKDL